MQTAHDLAQKAAAQPLATNSVDSSRPVSDLSKKAVAELFLRFRRRWSHKWRELDEDPYSRQVWWQELRAEGVTDTQLAAGIEVSRALPWPPSVGEFIELCRDPRSYGLPDGDQAWREASRLCHPSQADRRDWTHEAVHRAALDTGFSFVLGASKQAYQTFQRNYVIATRRVLAGESLDLPIPKAIPKTVEARKTPESNRKAGEYLDEMRRCVGLGGR